VGVPTLIVEGALDNPEVLRAGDMLHNKIRGAQKVVLPEAGHVPNMDKPVEFNRAMLKFLSGVGLTWRPKKTQRP
jgi:pimeloyl-ACP methyl ester carboxylesterase